MNIVLDQKKNFLQTIENAVGTYMFRNLWANVDGVDKDILEDGDLSCAQFVSGVLYLNGLIKERHATVEGTVRDIEGFGWKKIKEPKIGSILVWEAMEYPDGSKHGHIGFYVGDQKAISSSPKEKSPQYHRWTYARENESDYRRVSSIYWNTLLD